MYHDAILNYRLSQMLSVQVHSPNKYNLGASLELSKSLYVKGLKHYVIGLILLQNMAGFKFLKS
jgi:hypothetical protein